MGIALRSSATEWRSMEDVIDEVGRKWSTFDDIQKSAITTALAGTRQRDKLIATFNNYDKVLQATAVSTKSAGTAQEKYESYMDSIDAKLNRLTTTWENLVNNINGSSAFATVIDIGKDLLAFLDILLNDMHLLSVAPLVIVTAGFIKLTKTLGGSVKTLQIFSNAMQKAMTIGKGNKSIIAFGGELTSLSPKMLMAVAASANLNKAQTKLLLTSAGLSKEQIKLAMSTGAVTKAEGSATLATGGLKNAWHGLNLVIKANPLMAIVTVITTIISLISMVKMGIDSYNQKTQESIDKANELIDTTKATAKGYSDNIKKLKDLEEEFNTLSNGVDKYGKNLTLSTEQYNRYKDIVSQIVDMSPDIISGYNAEGEAIVNKNNLIQETIDKLNEEKRLELDKSFTTENKNTFFKGKKAEFDKAYNYQKDNYKSIAEADAELNGATGNFAYKNENIIISVLEEATGEDFEKSGKNILEWIDSLWGKINGHFSEIVDKAKNNGMSDTVASYFYDMLVASGDKIQASGGLFDLLSLAPQQVTGYSETDERTQAFIQSYIKNNFKIEPDTSTEVLNNNIDTIKSVTKKIVENPSSAIDLTKLYSLDTSNLNVDDYVKQTNELIKKIAVDTGLSEVDVKLALGIDVENLEDSFNVVKNKFNQMFGEGVFSEELANLSVEQIQFIANHLDEFSKDMSWDEIISHIDEIKAREELAVESTTTYLDKFTALTDAYNTMSSAVSEYNNGGFTSIESMKKLLSMSDEYLKYLDYENGKLVLNKEAMIESAKADYEKALSIEQVKLAMDLKAQANLILEATENKTEQATLGTNIALAAQAVLSGKASEGLLASAEDALAAAKAQAENGGIILENIKGYSELEDKIQNGYDRVKMLEGGLANVNSLFNSTASGGSSTADAWKASFEALYNELQNQRDLDLIDAQTYYDNLLILNQKYFSGSKKYLEEYQKYNKEVYDGLIKAAEEAAKNRANAEIDSIDAKIDVLQKQKEELQNIRKEEEDALKLQKAKDRYEAAKGQLNTRVYTNEAGWKWDVDKSELSDAKEELESIQQKIEDDKKAASIDEQIEQLQDMKEQWQDYMNNLNITIEDLGYTIDKNGNIVKRECNNIDKAVNTLSTNSQNSALVIKDAANKSAVAVYNGCSVVNESVGIFQNAMNNVASVIQETVNKINSAVSNINSQISSSVSNINSQISSSGSSTSNYKFGVTAVAVSKLNGLFNNIPIVSKIGTQSFYGAKRYANGIENGAADFTGYAWLDGTPSNPEYVLTSKQMENLVRNMSKGYNFGSVNTKNNNGDGDIIMENCTFPLNNVREPRDFTAALKQVAKQNKR